MSRTPLLSGSGLLRYGIATAGPVGSAGAQFLLTFVLLHVLDSAAFGRFSFLLLASQFSWGVWSALFCAPLPILYHAREAGDGPVRAMFSANLAGAVGAFLFFLPVAMAVGEGVDDAALFALYASSALLRWFARAGAYAEGKPLRATASDFLYSLILLAAAVLLPYAGGRAMTLVWGAMALSGIVGLLPFGLGYARRQFLAPRLSDLPGYGATWRAHGRWALLGVVTTEATANIHAYFVTILLGPTAFAPIAASALVIRPIQVAMNALTEFERARMARDIGAGRIDGALDMTRLFRLALLAAWVVTATATVALFLWNPRLVFPEKYAVETMAVASGLWLAVAAIRMARTPDSALLQAAGAFRSLAFASIWSSVASAVLVLALIALAGPVGSIGGILVGEALFALAIWRALRRWLSSNPKGAHADR